PTITASRTPLASTYGWNNVDVTAGFTCSDALSGLASGSPPPNIVVSSEGAGQSAKGRCVDLAGNSAAAMVSDINIDKTPPVVTGTVDRRPNGAGWYNAPVTVTWTATDALSGVAAVDPPATLSLEGTALSAKGNATDKAGNTGSAAALVKLDRTP